MKMIATTCLVLAAAVSLAGCYESPEANFYKPGVYKGKQDPLLKKQASEQQQDALRQRFSTGQTDR